MSGFLTPYRVLDVTDHRGLLAGHMLAQLGADVVELEPPGGSRARLAPPFAPDWPAGEASLYWAAYAAGKRSIVGDPANDPALWERLVRAADFLIDSAAPCEGRPAWLDPARVAALNPHIVHISVTPFGLTGPKRDWHDSEITLWAAGGPLLLTRDDEGWPLRISVPQAYLHGAATAAGAALIAHAAREKDGRGQHVDVAVLQSIPQCTLGAILAGEVGHPNFIPRARPRARLPAQPGSRAVDLSGSGSLTRRSKWQVADGLAEMHLGMGPASGPSTNKLFAWMREEAALPEHFADWDWTTLHLRQKAGEISADDVEEARALEAAFLRRLRKADLMQVAIDRGVRIAPIDTIADLANSGQFAARGFIAEVEGAFGRYRLPGAFASGCDGAFAAPAPAPTLDEHRDAILSQWTPRSVPAAPARDEPPLMGLKVLDLAWVVAGPLIGRNLADFGATVVRVESSRRVETARLMGPFPGGKHDVQRSALYDTCNTGKLGLSLDLSRAVARDVIRDLVRWADVLVESFTPGQMARWGLSYAELAAINPSLVMVSTSLTGQTGPYAGYSGYGNHGAAIAGFQNLVGHAGAMPVGPFGPYTDFVAPRFGLTAALAALDHRRRTGRGCWLDVSQTEAGVQFLAAQIAEHSVTCAVQGPAGNRDPVMAPHGVFPAEGDDAWIAVAVRSNAEWAALARLIGGSATDPAFATLRGRKEQEDSLERMVAAWTSARGVDEIETDLQRHGIAAHRLISSDDVARDPQFRSRSHVVRLHDNILGETIVESTPFVLSRTPAQFQRAAPGFGRDNEYVLRDILGYEDGRLQELHDGQALA
jgi:crotonobetainyl-CoA:carnitine CoA-transferase CaiB-like acyl-CoA transferase